MAKKKSEVASKHEFTPDMQLLTHKYSDYYAGNPHTSQIVKKGEENDEENSFVWYDTKEVFYPV